MSARDRGCGPWLPIGAATEPQSHGHSGDRGSATVSHSQPQSDGWPDRLAQLVAKAVQSQERKRAVRQVFAERRDAGLRIRHQTKLRRTGMSATIETGWTPAFAINVRAGARCHLCRQPLAGALVALAAAGGGPVCSSCAIGLEDIGLPLLGVADALSRIVEELAELPDEVRGGVAQVAGALLSKLAGKPS